MMSLFEGVAFAAEQANKPSAFEMFALPLGMILILYFLVFRPQQKKAKEHSKLLEELKPGDEVVTSGGIIGKVRSVAEKFVTLEVSSGTSIKVVKSNISAATKAGEQPST